MIELASRWRVLAAGTAVGVAAVVGFAINLIQETLKDKLGFLGGLLGGLFEFAWAAITYFVLPVLVVEGLGPVGAVKRSSSRTPFRSPISR